MNFLKGCLIPSLLKKRAVEVKDSISFKIQKFLFKFDRSVDRLEDKIEKFNHPIAITFLFLIIMLLFIKFAIR